jgi:hypothetical protein
MVNGAGRHAFGRILRVVEYANVFALEGVAYVILASATHEILGGVAKFKFKRR